jgi:amylosucrase
MPDPLWFTRQATASLGRLLPRLEERFADRVTEGEWHGFVHRVQTQFPRLFAALYEIYGHHYDFFFYLEDILATATRRWLERSAELKALDANREVDPQWFQARRFVGATCYVDLFAGNLDGVRRRIPYLMELGITYLHLMPLFKTPEGDNDGGYAVSSYREVDPALGTMAELCDLAAELRHHGISLCLDFIFNHTSDEHEWAKRALAGDGEYQEYYRMFADRREADAWEGWVNATFPDEHPGCFTYRSRIRRWVWTTFHHYQWDLNYENPAVFNRMVDEMLFLANQGVEVLRLDAIAFIWKRLGTGCQNLPEAHVIVQAFNALIRIAAPAMVFKSEAIVHPERVAEYIGEEECPLSYNPNLMALLWESLATRDVRLLRHAMGKRFTLPRNCAWVNYIRCHDDIGWVFADDDARELNIDARGHRRFLNDFYTGRFPGSFARGLPFQEQPATGDARVSGTTASLCGLEKALADSDAHEEALAIRRILLLHGVLFTIGGIPLLYLGDELGTLNDYGYTADPEKDGDSRWVHRSPFDRQRAELRRDPESVSGRIYLGLLKLVQVRQQTLAFTRSDTEIVDPGNDHVFAYFRHHEDQSVLVLANFTEGEQPIAGSRLRQLGWDKTCTDIVGGRTIVATQRLVMEPYQFMVLVGLG